ncbi:MAG: hypothetical protein Q7K55_03505 [Candidatus Levybacteria bacterium]|nr:hypothetical protein [Candidatus Levybacteria bacterium]
MTERFVFSTQDLEMVKAQDQYVFDVSDRDTCASESVIFKGDCCGVATIFKDTKTGNLKSLDNVIHDIDRHVSVYYDHNYWSAPFNKPGFEPDTNGPYKAVIVLNSVSRGEDGRLRGNVRYGTFWYDQAGELKVVNGGSITQNEYESPDAPTLKFRRMPSGNWQVFRLSGIQEPFLSYFSKGKIIQPEDVEISNGQEIEFDEIISSLTDDGKRFKFHQRTLTGHRQKTIEVPSRIDIPQWAITLNTLNGGWTKALTEFPSRIELLV